jgi:teichuronic acid biosynthesis glycosyltransferase TuaH
MDVICFSDINWDFLWQRHQQLLTRFPKTWNILFIEPSFLRTFKDKPHHILPRQVEENIFVTSFPMIPVFDRSQMLRRINDLLIIFWTRFAARILNFSNPIIIIYEPRYACTLGKIGELLSCYEIADDRLEFTQVPRWIEQKMDLLIKKSDLITLSANNLFVKIHKKRKKDLYVVGNGVDLEFFKNGGGIFPRPSDIPKINNPFVGYIGAIGEWFDFNLI